MSRYALCSVPDCDGGVEGRGLCTRHYSRWRKSRSPLPFVRPVDQAEVTRFLAFVNVSLGCWRWDGRKTPQRYGVFAVVGSGPQKQLVAAHRYAYELWVGTIPVGLVIDHLCRNTACVNPLHLEPVTVAENFGRGLVRSAAWDQTANVTV